jgi:hypothetical protein
MCHDTISPDLLKFIILHWENNPEKDLLQEKNIIFFENISFLFQTVLY